MKWTHYAMLNAEELGVTKANVDDMLKSDNPDIKRLLGTEGSFGEQFGLTKDWAYRIIKHDRKLRRVLREERRPGLADEHQPRPEQSVDQGRSAIRTAGSLKHLRGRTS